MASTVEIQFFKFFDMLIISLNMDDWNVCAFYKFILCLKKGIIAK